MKHEQAGFVALLPPGVLAWHKPNIRVRAHVLREWKL